MKRSDIQAPAIGRSRRNTVSGHGLLKDDRSLKLFTMSIQSLEATMATTKKIDKPSKKAISSELTYLDVRQAASDGQKAFEAFVITGKLPVTK